MRRELMHRVWDAMLDDEFLKAWDAGILVTCGDGVTRRLYPRIFTYSADYPEKLVYFCTVTIKSNLDVKFQGTPGYHEVQW